jgi:hypothetical protein
VKRAAIFGALLVIVGSGLLVPYARAADDPAALRADRFFVAALAKSDKSALDKAVDPEFTWTDANGKTLTRMQVLESPPQPIISDQAKANIVSRSYGQVEIVQAHSGKANSLRLWVKRPEGWQLLVYQEVKLMDTAPSVTPGTGSTCDNPCKSLPYQPKSATEQEVLKSYMALQTATVYHDAPNWGKFVADEFSAASSNSDKVLDKQGRMADLERSKMAGYAPVPVVAMELFDFPNVTILVSRHQPIHGKPLHITRLWIRRGGKWMEAVSYQTRIDAAAAAP